jgi:hypothetical protein
LLLYKVYFVVHADPKEVKRKRDREYYARHKDEISRRRREVRELKKQATILDNLNNDTAIWHTPSAGQSGVTQTPATGNAFLTSAIIYMV